MQGRASRLAVAVPSLGAIAGGAAATAVSAHQGRAPALSLAGSSPIDHVLLISVDGLHESDVAWYVSNHPESELAKLVAGGAHYTRARTPIPSDSFPGLVAQVTGANPRTAGVYYDDEYRHAVLEAGTTSCEGKPLG